MKKKPLSRIGTVIILTVVMIATYLPVVSLPVFAYNESCQLDFGEEPIRIYEAGYTDYSGSVTDLNLGTYSYVRFEVGAGTFTKTDGSESIPFLVDDVEHSTPGQTVKTNGISSADETINFSIYIDPNDWKNAAPGVYQTTLSGKGNFVGGNSTYLYGGFSLELTLTIPDYSNHYTVEVLQSDNGTICTNTETAAVEETVTVTATPDDGYKLDSVSVLCEEEAIETRRIDRTTFQFTMPNGNVSVTPSFIEKTVEDDFDYKVKDGKAILTKYYGDGGDLIIPGTIDGYSVSTLGERVFFQNSQITSVTFSEGLTSIENHAFYECTNLESVTLPQGLTNIGSAVFYGCSALEECNLPMTLSTIGPSAFVETALVDVRIPNGVTDVEDSTFNECQFLESVILPDGLKRIGKHAFCGCPVLNSITLPGELEVIDWYAFGDSGITDVYYEGTKTKWSGHVEKKDHWDCNADNSKAEFTMHYYSELTLDPNGADQTSEKVMVWSNETPIPQCCFTMDGKEFAEWNTKLDGTGQSYQPEELLPFEENTTLYAQWKNPKSPAFDLDDKQFEIGNRVWFGGLNEPLSSSWMILGSWNEGTILFISDKVLDRIQYNSTANGVRDWKGSTAQKWCTNFFNSADFSDVERMAIVPTTKEASSDSNYVLNHALEGERIFFLSSEELTALFHSDEDRAATGVTNTYWTRSIHSGVSTIYYVSSGGTIAGMGSTTSYCGARPAFNLDRSKVLFASSAENGKQSNGVGVDSLSPIGKNNTGEWKLTLKDSSRDSFTATVVEETSLVNNDAYANWVIPVSWSNARKGDNEFVSALLVRNTGEDDSDQETLYYGCIAQNSDSAEHQEIAMPEGLEVGDYSLLLFNEQKNGDKLTDYSSHFISFPLKVDHELTYVPAAPATCKSAGNNEYYTCECGKYFSDAEGKNEIEEGSWIIPNDPDSHDEEVILTPATMTRNGSIVTRCKVCGKELDKTTIYAATEINLSQESFEYTGSPKRPEISIIDANGDAVDTEYYDVSYKDNINAGLAKVVITGKGNYSGSKEVTFKISPVVVAMPPKGKILTYNGKEQTGVAAGTNYTVTSGKGINAKSYTAIVSLKDAGNYVWSDGTSAAKKVTWKILPAKVEMPSGKTLTYNGKQQTGVAAGTNYTVTSGKGTNAKSYTATVSLKDAGNYVWSDGTSAAKKVTWKISPKAITPTVTLPAKAYTYNGKAKKPSVTVKNGTTKLASSNFTVTYKNNTNVGKASITVKMKGDYSGSKTVKFKINPKGTTIKSLTAASKAVTVKWNKQAERMSTARITGYQIQAATDSKFTKDVKTVAVPGYSVVSRKITGLKGGKKYYVKIRTYKTISGVKYYSSWSKVKTITTKK